MGKKKLTEKEELFCQEFLRDFNIGKAYKRAGYSPNGSDTTHRINGYKLLTKDYISARITELKKEKVKRIHIDSDWMTMKLSNIVGANFMDIMKTVEEFDPTDETGQRTAKVLTFKDLTDIPVELQSIIKQVKYTKYGYEVLFEEKKWAFEMLAKHIGFYEKDNEQKKSSVLDDLPLDDKIKVIKLIQELNGNKQ